MDRRSPSGRGVRSRALTSILTVRHTTVYRYAQPVGLGEHRMMFRPRASHDIRLLGTSLTISPRPAHLRWLHDPFDNSVAVATFEGTTTNLTFASTVTLEHFEYSPPEYPLEVYARRYPFKYSDEDFPNLERGLARRYGSEAVSTWALQFLDPASDTPTVQVLRAMTHGIGQFRYVRRVEKGVQPPELTLATRQGSCRDFAVLMMEAARALGIAVRFVSGYIFGPERAGSATPVGAGAGGSAPIAGGGATHAWVQAYLPGAGWVDFDPTNNIIGNRNLIRVAVAWSPEQVLPLWGTYIGNAGDFIAMDVEVQVSLQPPASDSTAR
ncbi:MAG TPA: transglutaminase family protein [Vicinamibacterales bacterium]|nr:transglutaminase family protein [Vicinamibacterales bacterium]